MSRWKETLAIIAGVVATAEISKLAFSPDVRMEIFRRDKGVCQRCGKRFDLGYLIDCSHKPEVVGVPHNRNHPEYNNPNSGECLCLSCHKEVDSADPNAVYLINKRIRETHGGRTRKWLEEHGVK